jgi:hypothetical protein
MIRASKNSPRLARDKRQANNSTRRRSNHDTELKRQIVLHGRWGTVKLMLAKTAPIFVSPEWLKMGRFVIA